MFRTTYAKLSGRLYWARRNKAIKAALAELDSICKDCGIDLPSAFHWDGCTYGSRTRVR